MSLESLASIARFLKKSDHQSFIGGSKHFFQLWLRVFLENNPKYKVIVVSPKKREAEKWYHSFKVFMDRATFLPEICFWAKDRYLNLNDLFMHRSNSLELLWGHNPGVCFASIGGLGQTTMDPNSFHSYSLRIDKGQELEIEELEESLKNLGYQIQNRISEKGEYSIRGGILDVFPPQYANPLRIEFFADEVASIRTFEQKNQRSLTDLTAVKIIPCREIIYNPKFKKETAQKIFNYLLESPNVAKVERDGIVRNFQENFNLGGSKIFYPLLRSNVQLVENLESSNILIVSFSRISELLEEYQALRDDFVEKEAHDIAHGQANLPIDKHYLSISGMEQCLRSFLNISRQEISAKNSPSEKWPIETTFSSIQKIIENRNDHRFELFDFLQKPNRDIKCIIIIFSSNRELNEAKQLFEMRKLYPETLKGITEKQRKESKVYFLKGIIESYYYLSTYKMLFIPINSLVRHLEYKKPDNQNLLVDAIKSFEEIDLGDLIVHIEHGVGRYCGITQLEVGDKIADFIKLEYANRDKVFLPVDKLNLLQRYKSSLEKDSALKTKGLDKLGSLSWEKKKASVRKSIEGIAVQLLETQAKRNLAKAPIIYDFPKEYQNFVDDFPYQETEDQLRVLNEVHADLQKSNPMDRLLVGDVGFGKTEVALRASMRAILEGYQVLVLVPTTVLCYQHFHLFRDRLARYGVSVAQLNRFVERKESKEIFKKLEDGLMDVVIGTHKMLSQSLKVKKIGLIIIDEEQKFGVVHKEKLKKIRKGAHVLTLTATPIPRTLHMALSGLRDISIITTPPQNRKPVHTLVHKYDLNVIKNAIQNELSRNGQVFFVHNRVQDISEVGATIQEIIPHASVRVAHGKLDAARLEKVILDFIENKFQILVCTTIIESGVDMPNVNTLIINEAENFGLSQLYQLRGRVGRSSQQAYAYFLTKRSSRLSDEAKRRLEAIVAHQALGSGFQISNIDLEIRGAGNLLGDEQSGFVSAVGLEMYTRLLNEEVKRMKGIEVVSEVDPEIILKIKAFIPSEYISDDRKRLKIYREIFSESGFNKIDSMSDEIVDLFGRMPDEVENLFLVAKIKRVLISLHCRKIKEVSPKVFEIEFEKLDEAKIKRTIDFSEANSDKVHLTSDFRLRINLVDQKGSSSDIETLLNLYTLLSQMI